MADTIQALDRALELLIYLNKQGREVGITQIASDMGVYKSTVFRTLSSAYINGKRLNYAANLLIHTDMEIVDVIYESGFQSINYFYHLFKKEYGISPVKYKKIHLVQKL